MKRIHSNNAKTSQLAKTPAVEAPILLKQPPVLFPKTQEMVKQISKLIDGVFITYWNGNNGSICGNDVIAIYDVLQRVKKTDTLYLFIKSDGGNGKASLRIVNMLRQYCKHMVALVPLECASAATMLAIGADEIQMGPMAYLTAVDTSLTHALSPVDRDNDLVSVSLDELNRVIRSWRKQRSKEGDNPYQHLYEYVHPLVIGAVDRAESLSIMLCEEILGYHLKDQAKITRISQKLNSGYPSHSYPIILKTAKEIGLNATELDDELHHDLLLLNEYYSEMGQRAFTDYDQTKYHTNEILNIIEVDGLQLYYQQDKDMFFREQDRRWLPMNDNSSWRKCDMANGKMRTSVFHIA
jgi:dihydroxyacetone kinase DhaKLM complex PTS-EIIA-like component DhaM